MSAAPETWSGRAGFVLAAIGSAVGLGSIWKFPYEVGANGGAAFVLFYLAGLALVPATSYEALLASPARMSAYHALFLAAATAIVARGVGKGIEAACKVLMPLLAALMLGLATYGVIVGDARAALDFLFRVDPSAFTARAALEALGLGFFSIGVGFSLMITYAAYARRDIDLRRAALWSVGADTAISLAAGFAVFPLVFAYGLDPASGPGLVFVSLPLAFERMPFGGAVALAFFALLFVAALASAISMLELAVAPAMRRLGWPRPLAAAAVSLGCFLGGLATVFSFNLWSHWKPTAYELIDHLTSNVMLPAGGLALAFFAGWALPRQFLVEELGLTPRGAALLHGLLRWLTPALIALTAVAPAILR